MAGGTLGAANAGCGEGSDRQCRGRAQEGRSPVVARHEEYQRAKSLRSRPRRHQGGRSSVRRASEGSKSGSSGDGGDRRQPLCRISTALRVARQNSPGRPDALEARRFLRRIPSVGDSRPAGGFYQRRLESRSLTGFLPQIRGRKREGQNARSGPSQGCSAHSRSPARRR